jgi:thiol:disulfide interchange protein
MRPYHTHRSRTYKLLALLCPLLLALLSFSGERSYAQPWSNSYTDERVTFTLSPATCGTELCLRVNATLAEHWHLYWKYAGDSGLPPRFTWEVPPGITLGKLQWPIPERIKVGPLVNFGYEGSVDFLFPLDRADASLVELPTPITLGLSWLVCKEDCVPGKTKLSISSVANPETPPPSRSTLPLPTAPFAVGFKSKSETAVELTLASTALSDVFFFPDNADQIDNSATQHLETQASSSTLSVKLAAATVNSLSGLLSYRQSDGDRAAFEIMLPFDQAGTHAKSQTLPPALQPAAPEAAQSLLFILLTAFVGGLILNIMPCVLPVLALKVVSLASEKDKRHKRIEALCYTAGTVASMVALAGTLVALRSFGHELGWGFQLQSPLVTASLTLIVLLAAVNLLGAFEVGMRLQTAAGSVSTGEGYRGAFFTGVLAVVLASPCSAPFVVTAISAALSTQGSLGLFCIFSMLGLGLAFPYLLIAFVPAAARLIPRPGNWLELTRKLLAFPLLATALWLLWVAERMRGFPWVLTVLSLCLMASLGAVLLGYGQQQRKRRMQRIGGFLMLLSFALLPLLQPAASTSAAGKNSIFEVYSEERAQQALQAGKAVFLDFTAAWCITCQVNKRLVLETDALAELFKRKGVLALRADWTNQDAQIAQALARYGRSSVPTNVLLSPKAAAPTVFPTFLSLALIEEALPE